MDAVLNWLWQGGVVALALAAMLRLLERSGAQVRYLVCWTALLLVMVLPFMSLAGRSTMPEIQSVAVSGAAPMISVPNAWWTSVVIIAAWALWTAFSGIRLVIAMLALRRAKTSARPFPTTVAGSLHHWERVNGQGRRATLVVSDRVGAAAVFGCGAPMIAVAPALVDQLDADELDRVLIHEWAHVQRRDDLAHVLQILAHVIAGWHPAIWWIDRRLQTEREVATDEMTVAVTGSSKAYAACLVKLAGLRLGGLNIVAAPGALSSTDLSARIVRLVSRRESPAWSRGAALGGIAVLLALSLSIAGLRPVVAGVPAVQDVWVLSRVPDVQPTAFEHISAARIGAGPSVAEPLTVAPRSSSRLIDTRRSSSRPKSASPPIAPSVDPATEARALEPVPLSTGTPQRRSSVVLQSARIDTPVALSPEVSVQQPGAQASVRSPWSAAAGAGVALGRESKDAGVATANFFNRFAMRLASSF